jgi:hypothetical protein
VASLHVANKWLAKGNTSDRLHVGTELPSTRGSRDSRKDCRCTRSDELEHPCRSEEPAAYSDMFQMIVSGESRLISHVRDQVTLRFCSSTSGRITLDRLLRCILSCADQQFRESRKDDTSRPETAMMWATLRVRHIQFSREPFELLHPKVLFEKQGRIV